MNQLVFCKEKIALQIELFRWKNSDKNFVANQSNALPTEIARACWKNWDLFLSTNMATNLDNTAYFYMNSVPTIWIYIFQSCHLKYLNMKSIDHLVQGSYKKHYISLETYFSSFFGPTFFLYFP